MKATPWLGAVLDAPDGSGSSVGELVVGIVRRPDPVPHRGWLERVITRRVPMGGFADAPHKNDDDVKVVGDLNA